MILTAIQDYLSEHKRAALTDLSHHLSADPEALRRMLSILERKGRVRKLPAGPDCGSSCNQCAPESIEMFEWVG